MYKSSTKYRTKAKTASKKHNVPSSHLSLLVIRNELITIGHLTKKFKCERAVAEWYYDMAGKNKKRATDLITRAIALQTQFSSSKVCVICQETITKNGENAPGGKYCFNKICRAEECQGSVCAKCVEKLDKCPWCRYKK